MPLKILMQLMAMMLSLVRTLFADKASLAFENLVLRQQLVVLQRRTPRPRLDDFDRAFWATLKDHFTAWADALVIVKPETVVRWHTDAFRKHWARKSGPGPGRPRILQQHIDFIKRISGDHPEYGEDRIALELELKLGARHCASTIRKYMVKGTGPGRARAPQSWSTFLKNQAGAIWTCDFCVQRTVRFTALYIFVIMELGTRRVMHINVTQHPTQDWVRQPFDGAQDRQIRTSTRDAPLHIAQQIGQFVQVFHPLSQLTTR